MRFFLLSIYITFFIGNETPAMATTPIRIMTYNIRLDFAGDNQDNWQERKSDMVDYIIAKNPDFIGVQEALDHQAAFLDDALENYAYVGVGRDDGHRGGEFMAIFYNRSKWETQTSGTFWLSPTPGIPSMGWDAACHRVCTYGIFRQKDGASIALFNTHFDHVGQVARKESVEVLKTHIATLLPKYPTVLCGDFNVTPEDTVYTLLNTFFTDSRSIALAKEEVSKGTFNAFKSVGPFERRIDYVFVQKEGIEVNKYTVEMPLTQLGRQLSDHFPLIVDLEIE